ncbi:MAG: ThiF family adenylyltransferase, partial [Bacilli bacterium]
ATDNFTTRFLLNDLSYSYDIPWIYGGVLGTKGVVSAFVPGVSACWHCLFDALPVDDGSCDREGVLASTVLMVGAQQWTEAIRLIVEGRAGYVSKLWSYDSWRLKLTTMQLTGVQQRAECQTCGAHATFPYLKGKETERFSALCGRDAFVVHSRRAFEQVKLWAKQNASIHVVNEHEALFTFTTDGHRFVCFKDGRMIIHGVSNYEDAKRMYDGLFGA